MHLTIDDAFMDIGAGLGRLTFLPKVLIEHLHPAGGKVPWRDVVRSYYAKDRRTLEEANLARYREEDFAFDINRLQDALGLPVEPVLDLAPGQTFRRKMTGQPGNLPMSPTLAELEARAGRPLRPNSPLWLKMRREWLREGEAKGV